jgi:hypothetical protein
MFRPYKAIFRQHLYKDTNSLYANYVVFLRYFVDVPSYLFELRLFLCHIRFVVFVMPVKHCLAFLIPKAAFSGGKADHSPPSVSEVKSGGAILLFPIHLQDVMLN